ncbi:hypothetical protein jhhlp_001176 [Lomentospora prolificans]|uniref:RNase MRP protein 1 RNA binding domain-containing protein n=1 Tax=Lomentospora prolificans TaxID=41688 RepID=A0A2N3NHR0_9PEZI|nr:hypothetical protein jhhlp_001176 [Lomentospora prolificans]
MASAHDLPSQLGPISTLLEAFNHRNKNQHRRSAWWQHFNLFRRAVRKLCSPGSYAASGPAFGKHGGRQLPAAAVTPAPPSLLRHIKWVMENVIPPSYIAFTQLAADNQYAPLGLGLLGILAQFTSVISPLAPPSSPTQSLPAATAARPSTNKVNAPPGSSQPLPGHPPPADLGVVVERSELPTSSPPSSKPIGEPIPKKRPCAEATAAPIRKRQPPPPTLSEPISDSQPEKAMKTKKKKKKQAPGTDLSDLFSSIA